jgi:hypothetical protein
LFLTIMSGLFARSSLSVCTPWSHNTLIPSCSVTGLGMWDHQFSVVAVPNFLHIEQCRCVKAVCEACSSNYELGKHRSISLKTEETPCQDGRPQDLLYVLVYWLLASSPVNKRIQ